MADPNIYRCTPRKVRQFMIEILEAGLVPYVHSSPGMGKSAITRSIAQDAGLKMIDHRLSTSSPEDLSGLPRFNDQGFAEFAPFADLFPIEGTTPPEDKNGWLVFLDEFPSAPKSVQAAAYKLVLDKMVGQHKLHENVHIAAAGNLMTDRAIVNPIGTAMQSRVIHLEMELSFEEWLYDVAFKENYDPRIIAYLSQYPSKLMDFRPDHNDKTFACPRTWEFMNRLVKGNEVTEDRAPLYAGTITSGMAVDFIQFTSVFKDLVKVSDILNDPDNCHVPYDNNTRWATISSMMEKITDQTFDKMSTYANRFPLDFRILFFRSAMIRQPALRKHPAFARAMSELSHYLNG